MLHESKFIEMCTFKIYAVCVNTCFSAYFTAVVMSVATV